MEYIGNKVKARIENAGKIPQSDSKGDENE
jgi:hypothetical protein